MFDLRFPGQRYDRASGLYYNYFRDYDPSAGRYTQSDPIGLDGGISTYGYVGSATLQRTDRRGLVYGNGELELEDVFFGSVVWVNEQLGWNPSLDQSTVDLAAGFGDGVSGGLTSLARNGLGVNGVVNRCSSIYKASEWAGIAAGLAVPVGRIAYVAKVGALPRSGMAVEQIVARRSRLKTLFRGRPLDRILPMLGARFGIQQ